ncbi:MAG: redoxin domain-containing protein [Deltaproteobacteria bacterium]|nr:redoxin domain-containing protein [Deltaproteobacteria bacterium]
MWTALLLGLAAAGFLPSTAEAFRSLKEGAPAPDFTLKSTKGDDVSLGSFKDKAVVLAFVRQGQDKSDKVLKALSSLDEALAAKSQVLIVVANPSEGDAAAWAGKSGGSLTVLLDPGEDVYAKYGALVAPATGVIKPDGTFLAEVAGYSASYKDEVEGLLKVGLGLATAEQVKAEAEKAKVGDTPEARKAAERELDKARLLVQRKMRDKALEPAKQAVASDDTYAPAHAFLGRLLLDESDANADEALTHFDRALELAPKDVEAKIGAARVKALKGDIDGAVSLLEDAAKLNPKPERVYYQLGLVYEKGGQNEKAAEAYRKALEKLIGD